MSATVRRAGVGDVGALAGLRRQWRLERHGAALDADPGFDERFRSWVVQQLDRDTLVWVAESGAPVGMLLMFVHTRMPEPGRDAGRWGYVGNTFVLPRARDAGVGSRLLDAALAHADAHGFARVVLNPTRPSVPFYERAGFTSHHRLLVRE